MANNAVVNGNVIRIAKASNYRGAYAIGHISYHASFAKAPLP